MISSPSRLVFCRQACTWRWRSNSGNVDNQVGSGCCGTVSEYVCNLIRADKKRAAQEKLEAWFGEGLQSGEPSEMIRQDWDGIRCQALRPSEFRRSRKPA